MLELRNVTKSYRVGSQELKILKGVSLNIESGEFVAIMGPSGSGKSTLMNLLGLLDTPTSGSYLLDGFEISELSEDELAVLRRDTIGFVFQQFNLLPRMTAEQNVGLPLFYSKKYSESTSPAKLLQAVSLEDRKDHRPSELSGGQQQRVAIARSLVNQPQVVLADEPTGNLDSASQAEIMRILENLNQQGITIIIVTHEEEVAAHAGRIIKVRDGVIQSDTKTRQGKNREVTTTKSNSRSGQGLKDLLTHFHQGITLLAANKVRTALSTLGIMIGVAAVVAMLAIGQGAQRQIEEQLASLGSNLLVLRTGVFRVGGVSQDAGSLARLSPEDASFLKSSVQYIKEVASQVNGRGQVTFLNKNWSTSVLGATAAYPRMHAAEPALGRFFSDEETQARARVAVIGLTLQRELFGERSPIGELIKVNKVNFQVIGVLPEKGANGFRNQDDILIIPYTTAMYRLLGKTYVDSIELEIDQQDHIADAQEVILQSMYSRHRVPTSVQEEAYQIFNMSDIQNAMAQTSKTMSLLLAVIAAISLIVGGIGIMNIMLVSVTERTREIGLRKAVGATRLDIRLQFLVESVVISVLGGLFGIFIGWLATILIAALSGWTTMISGNSILLSFVFSAGVGVLFGVYPANKASKLNPIEALRYE